jgi:hypothetical protein
MSEVRTGDKIVQIERRLLRGLCRGVVVEGQRAEIMHALAAYQWRGTEHQVVFEVLHKLKNASPETIRANLAAELTRKGFPDVDIAVFLEFGEISKENWIGLVQVLLNSARATP